MGIDRSVVQYQHIHHASSKLIPEMFSSYEPIFVLSTGRSGTSFITELLQLSPQVQALHEPEPTLQYFSDFAYHQQEKEEVLTKIFETSRLERIFDVYIRGKLYAESNQCMTFFAPYIAKVFSKAKFVHLIRHPGDFARSAIRKGWYRNDTIWESGRLKSSDKSFWESADSVQKLGWLWNTTNEYIEGFKTDLGDQSRIMTVKLEDLYENQDVAQKLFEFIGVDIPLRIDIQRLQSIPVNAFQVNQFEPPNMHKVESFPRYNDWSLETKNRFKNRTGLAEKYGYVL